MKQAKPILHGRDHAPGGADPIPGLGEGGGGGIQFDTTPQTGGFLEATATGADGISLRATGDDILIETEGAGNNTWIGSLDGKITIDAWTDLMVVTHTGLMYFGAQTTLTLLSGAAGISLGASAAGNVQINSGTTGNTTLISGSGGIRLRLNHASATLIVTNAGGTATLFRIDQDGSLHGKTGKSLVFDL